MDQLAKFLHRFHTTSHVSSAEMVASALAAFLSLALVTWISKQALSGTNLPFILASMGATAVILFAAPNSPMGRAWPLWAGHLISAIIGITCGKLFHNLLISVPIAIGVVIFAMHYLRCIHPPGGATALLTLLGGHEVSAVGYQFLLTPLAINLSILAMGAYMIRRLRAERRRRVKVEIPESWQQRHLDRRPRNEPTSEDLQAALDSLNRYVDIDAEQLQQIYTLAHQQHRQRLLHDLSCGDIMNRDVQAMAYGDRLIDGWRQLSHHADHALVVVNRARLVEGIITVSDFIRHAEAFDHDTEQERIAALIEPTTDLSSEKAEALGQIMTPSPHCVTQSLKATELWQLFEHYEVNHLPVIDDNHKLVGMVTRSLLEQRLQ